MTINTYPHRFETSSPTLRIVASASVAQDGGAGWQVVGRIGGDVVPRGADAWLLAAVDLDGIALDSVLAATLPLVLATSDSNGDGAIPADWLDAADGFVLPDDSPETTAAVLARVIAPAATMVVADMADGTARAINALSAEAGRIAQQLARLAEEQRAPTAPQAIEARFVRRIIKLRRDRERFFPAEMLADPAWDMLLDLTAARLEGKRVPVSSLCIAAAVPTTTALRWIRSLTEAGLFERYVDPGDARRSYVEIADPAAASMLAYLRAFNEAFALR